MIRLFLLLLFGAGFYLLARANGDTLVVLQFVGRESPPIHLHWVLLYTFLGGAVAYALFTFPERLATWRALRKHKKQLRKMGKNLSSVITHADPHHL